MGLLVEGEWKSAWYDTKASQGRFQREESRFRNWITAEGSSGFAPEPDRYHLYISYACPWAHRTLIYRALKGLQQMIGVSAVHWFLGTHGWTFEPDGEGIVGDRLHGKRYLYEIYLAADPKCSGRVTVPVLWDKKRRTIVSNESSEIIRMLGSAFDGAGAERGDFYPSEKREEIDQLNERIYTTLNNGVYRAGFATTQDAYDEAVVKVFETLDWLEARLAKSRFLTGAQPTEADWRLLPTLLRFDLVYHGHFKCNRRRIVDYSNLWGYTRDLYQWPGIAGTCNFEHARRHYYASHDRVNPTRIVAIGPALDFDAPTDRAAMATR